MAMEWDCLAYESDSYYIPTLAYEFYKRFTKSDILKRQYKFHTEMVGAYF